MVGDMKPLAVLLAELKTAIDARKDVETRLAPLVSEYELARQAEDAALAAVQNARASTLLNIKLPKPGKT